MPRPLAVMARVPLTTALVVAMLVLGAVTGSLWDALQARPLLGTLAYGLPAFEDGRWWTLATGSFFALQPLQYVPVLVGMAVFGGFTEWRLGTGKAAAALATTQLAAVVGSAALLWLIADHGYDWATRLSHDLDAGPSAGFLGGAAAATVTLVAPWRGRARSVLAAYVFLSLVHGGGLADLEHFIAVALGLALGPMLFGRAPRLTLRPLARGDYRLLACAFFVVAAVEGMVQPFTTLGGPLASTMSDAAKAQELANRDLVGGIVQAVLWLWLARSLYKGRRLAWRWAFGLLVLVLLTQVVGLAAMLVQGEPGLPAATYDLAGNAFGLAVLVFGRRAFRNPSPRRARRTTGSLTAPATDDERDLAVARLREVGTVNNLAWMTTWPENRWFEHPAPGGFVAYRVHAGVAIGLCDPVARDEAERSELLRDFADHVHAAGLVPCLFTVTGEASRHATALGWHSLQVAEEAVVDLPSLRFTGKAWQDVRTAMNQANRQGIELRLGALADQPRGIQTQVRAISTEWVQDKGLPEMGFTLGGVDEALDPRVRVGLAVDADATVHGVTSWMPVYGVGGAPPVGWTLDVMRRMPGGFRYTMEFLIAASSLAFKDEGAQLVSLSGAPLARTDPTTESSLDRGTLDVFLDRLGAALEPYYGFRSLHTFKTKFQPQFDPLYLVFPDEAALPRIGLALSRAYLPDAGVRDLITLTRSGRQAG